MEKSREIQCPGNGRPFPRPRKNAQFVDHGAVLLLSPVTATAASTSECAFLASRASNEQYILALYASIFVLTRNSPARRTASVQEGAGTGASRPGLPVKDGVFPV